jgi:hypothetical protein
VNKLKGGDRVKERFSPSILPWVVWIFTLVAIPFWMANDGPLAWDLDVILSAMHSVHNGADPYQAGMANQDAFLKSPEYRVGAPRPFVYVYSPITLPLLKLMGNAPEVVVKTIYWSMYMLAILLQLWVVSHLPGKDERIFVGIVTPITLFFPGLLLFDSVFSGNVAFMLYGLMLAGFLAGWKQGRWRWFYLAVLVASCFKAPYLIYLALPLFCASRRWMQVAAASVAGLALFGMQAVVWPTAFHSYTQALDRIFSYNNDFGSGPAGRFGATAALIAGHYAVWGAVVYLVLTLSLFVLLLYFARFYKKGLIRGEQWFPLMLVGLLLMNPRLIEYDIFPFTVPMMLILYRLIRPLAFVRLISALLLALWCAANYFANRSHEDWKYMECGLLLLVFAAGCWCLLRQIRTLRVTVAQPAD